MALLVLQPFPSWAAEWSVDALSLPPLTILGQPAQAHTQGLELAGGHYYVTARRDDVQPKRALLLRTAPGRKDWDVWDITPEPARGDGSTLDHPGGMQSDGERLWIPLAESRRNGRSVIRVFAIADMTPGRPLKPEFEFAVSDHIGAVAVASQEGWVIGASWDTETVFVWDLRGRRQRTLTGVDLDARGLGIAPNGGRKSGIAVQDWKVAGGRLFAGGLLSAETSTARGNRSRLAIFSDFLEPGIPNRVMALPAHEGTELAHEGMAVSEGAIYFLPEDLGATNQLFRARHPDLLP